MTQKSKFYLLKYCYSDGKSSNSIIDVASIKDKKVKEIFVNCILSECDEDDLPSFEDEGSLVTDWINKNYESFPKFPCMIHGEIIGYET